MTDKAAGPEAVAPRKAGRVTRWLIRFCVIGVALLVVFSALIGVAEHKTSQSQFCSSCHIMEPYYETWTADAHGAKLEVACVECHYAPGERTTIKAKFRGLSQVTSYFSGRYGAGRPRAYVSNLSCLTAQCHGDLKFMDKPLLLDSVRFVHSNHLNRDAEREKPHEQRFEELGQLLKGIVGEARFGELDAVASEVGPAQERYDRLVELCRQWDVAAERESLIEYSRLRHRSVRIAQLRDLQCTSCHSYHATDQKAVGKKVGNHFQVATTTCYTCHFNNAEFDVGTATCLSCHTPPQQEITVHAEMALNKGDQAAAQDTATKLVKMNHAQILANKVACASCHADAMHTEGLVTRRDCERCHDQPRFFADWKEPFSVDLVQKYHSLHVERQKAKCLDCHAEIQHRLVPSDDLLTSALADCARCHPNHHAEQVNLLLGRGGLGVPQSTPNLMFGARTNCTGCHTESHGDAAGSAVKATEQSCIACHGDRHKDTFAQWKLGIEITMTDAEEAFKNATTALGEATGVPPDVRSKAEGLVKSAETDLNLVKNGNGLHNVTYAMELLDSVTARCREAIALLENP
jgi:nitrate/TMAO reductase-like tetraheme cytochrome c subunit